MSFRDRLAEGRREVAKKTELKALRKAPADAEWVNIKIVGMRNLNEMAALGWEVMSSESSNFGHDLSNHFMRKKRAQILLDNE